MMNPTPEFRGKPQKVMLPTGEAKDLKCILEERGFNVNKLRAKCLPVCPIESQNCCMARLLSQQDDFKNQPSMIDTLIKAAGHKCIFVRSTPFSSEPTRKQEQRKNQLEVVSLWTPRWNPKRTEQRTNYYMS